MSVAILVLAYREPEVLARAVKIYKHAGFDVFVHLDAKSDLDQYKSKMGSTADFCTFLAERSNISWAGFEMITATMRLLRSALKGNYTNFALASDDTFPIRDVPRLSAILSSPANRISVRPLRSDENFAKRYHRFFYFDHPAMSLLGREIESSHIDIRLLDAMDRLKKRMDIGKDQLQLYYGSQWWSLPRLSAEYALETYENNTSLKESFEFSAVPDEMYIQSVLGNSPHLRSITPSPVIVDWSRNPKPYVFKHASEFTNNIDRHHAFVRKVPSSSQELLAELERICLAET
ncbi:hypothetical protein BB934_15875 [Microvirga ossetica]|uniref:Peptide O-xylosyltransferase n=1 Tax=Microvirga ossetica TaxID=1882682 RepID=A0A1B2EHV5_9HYPH|nr:beta-1,6-N-acetylglucosaminyltransferase [Microvirga ossetica]ANY79519.1 hypothetical protein BB934_15875 [Microvirga ossetica]